jgi:hypothetical protein
MTFPAQGDRSAMPPHQLCFREAFGCSVKAIDDLVGFVAER